MRNLPRCRALRLVDLSLAAILALALAVGAPAAATEAPAGPAPLSLVAAAPTPRDQAFDIVDLDWHDAARDRAVPARLYWPRTSPGSPIPLVVFSHGIGGSRTGYSYLGQYWASHGFASLHVQHVGSDRQLWGGNVFSLLFRLQQAAQDGEAIDRVRDVSFALDRILDSERGPRIDRARVVAAGHSYGANTALLAAGARVSREGRQLQLRDPRFTAAILISAPPFYGETDFAPILADVHIPTLHVTATDDVIEIPGFHSPASDRVKVFDATGSRLKVLAMFEGGSHSMFTDRRRTGDQAPQVKAATQALSVAFLRRAFEGAEDALAAWNASYRGLVARYVVN